MSDIPEEITELATEIYAAMRDGESEEATAKLSRALLSAEARGMERAAKIAEDHAESADLNKKSAWSFAEETFYSAQAMNARNIAAAIRNGTEA